MGQGSPREQFPTWQELGYLGACSSKPILFRVWFRAHRPTGATPCEPRRSPGPAGLSCSGVAGELGTSHPVLQLQLSPGGLLGGGGNSHVSTALWAVGTRALNREPPFLTRVLGGHRSKPLYMASFARACLECLFHRGDAPNPLASFPAAARGWGGGGGNRSLGPVWPRRLLLGTPSPAEHCARPPAEPDAASVSKYSLLKCHVRHGQPGRPRVDVSAERTLTAASVCFFRAFFTQPFTRVQTRHALGPALPTQGRRGAPPLEEFQQFPTRCGWRSRNCCPCVQRETPWWASPRARPIPLLFGPGQRLRPPPPAPHFWFPRRLLEALCSGPRGTPGCSLQRPGNSVFCSLRAWLPYCSGCIRFCKRSRYT